MTTPDFLAGHLLEGPSDPETPFCPECGQLFGRSTTELGWKSPARPRWVAWMMIVLGAALTFTIGKATFQSARERMATGEILRGLPAWEAGFEGPSSRFAALRSAGPPGIVDRYVAAERHVSISLAETAFPLGILGLGTALLAGQSAQRRRACLMSLNGGERAPRLLDPVRRAVFEGSALAETVALSAIRLLTIAFLYLLMTRVVAGEAPTPMVVQETLDRLIQIVARLPDLLH